MKGQAWEKRRWEEPPRASCQRPVDDGQRVGAGEGFCFQKVGKRSKEAGRQAGDAGKIKVGEHCVPGTL